MVILPAVFTTGNPKLNQRSPSSRRVLYRRVFFYPPLTAGVNDGIIRPLLCMNEQTELQGLIKKQETLRHRMFLLILEIAFWFGIPAFGAFFLGNHLDDTYGTGSKYLLIFLIIAFVCSWIAVIWRTKTLAKKLTDAERRVREAKENSRHGTDISSKNDNLTNTSI